MLLPGASENRTRCQNQGQACRRRMPPPDLAIEIDISPPEFDRPGIYAAIKIAELWRFDGEKVVIERLGRDGRYRPAAASRLLKVRANELTHWLCARIPATKHKGQNGWPPGWKHAGLSDRPGRATLGVSASKFYGLTALDRRDDFLGVLDSRCSRWGRTRAFPSRVSLPCAAGKILICHSLDQLSEIEFG